MSETLARKLVTLRAAGSCEAGRHAPATDWAHRIARGRGGAWSPANGLLLCRWHHDWSHANQDAARALGWMVHTEHDPETTPVWIDALNGPGWWLLRADGTVEWLDDGATLGRPDMPVPPPLIPRPRTWKAPGAHR